MGLQKRSSRIFRNLPLRDMLSFGLIDDIVKEPLGGTWWSRNGKMFNHHIKKEVRPFDGK
ncbi:MAG: hypothetical protein IPL23_20085 [Saprospiraceae bacterium]|nr:hypothetical protein [Saprospiraceae bacterium]